MTSTVHQSICRICTHRCAVLVDVEDGRVVKVSGDRDDPESGGYTCVKGRTQADLLYHPDRLLHSLKRTADGAFIPIPIEDVMDEIATKLVEIRSRFGARAIAGFSGHFRGSLDGPEPLYEDLFDLLGSEMRFTPNTIDKGGKYIASAMHGWWMAPWQGFERPEAGLLIGVNPLVSHTTLPGGSGQRWLTDALKAGMQLVVIDPRRTETAQRATLHLQARPGHDPEILAAIIRVILENRLEDHAFIAENVQGAEALRRAVADFDPVVVGARSGLDPDDIVAAARMLAGAKRCFEFAGTGPSMAGYGSLTEYLLLVVQSICGHWTRAGEKVVISALRPAPTYKAQAEPPSPWKRGNRLRVRSLYKTASGMPTAALADEILLPGPGQVHGLISWGGNPAVSFPDQLKVIEALRSLDLLVQVDPWMTPTSQLAHYVIAPTMPLEVPGVHCAGPNLKIRVNGYGGRSSYASYTPAIVDPPAGSDLIEEWRFLQGVYNRVRSQLVAAGEPVDPVSPRATVRTTDQLLDLNHADARVSLGEVRAAGRGRCYPAEITVAPRDAGWRGRLDVGNPEMMAMLDDFARTGGPVGADDAAFPFRLLTRRANHIYNSVKNVTSADGGRRYNPAYMHPDDLAALGLAAHETVRIESSRASMLAIVEPDPTLSREMVSMVFGFGSGPESDHLVEQIGSAPNRLVPDDDVFDPFMGQPRMSNLPVRVVAVAALESSWSPSDG